MPADEEGQRKGGGEERENLNCWTLLFRRDTWLNIQVLELNQAWRVCVLAGDSSHCWNSMKNSGADNVYWEVVLFFSFPFIAKDD